MERGGTGGSIFRNLYRDFLRESYQLLGWPALHTASRAYADIADQWRQVAHLLDHAGESADIAYIEQAAAIMANLSEQERDTMETLNLACASLSS